MNKVKAGILAALVTPYHKDHSVNYAELKKMVRRQADEGVDGFYVSGSTAEAFCLTDEERIRSVDAVCEEVGDRCFIVAHVGNIGTDKSIYLAKEAQKSGAHAISSVPPFYYKFSEAEVLRYYLQLASSTELPFICYNFPSLSGVMLTADMVAEMAKNPLIQAVKYTCSDFYQLERMKTRVPGLVVYNGLDEMFLSGLAAGADGAIGSTFNIMPRSAILLQKAFRAGDITGAQGIQADMNAMIAVIVKVGVMPSIKSLLRRKGIECNGCRAPFTNTTAEQDQLLARTYDEYIAKYDG